MFAQSGETSWFHFLRNDGEDHVLVASPHHCPQDAARSDNLADVAGRGDLLAVDADDDVSVLESRSVTHEEETRISFQTVVLSANLGQDKTLDLGFGSKETLKSPHQTQLELIGRD